MSNIVFQRFDVHAMRPCPCPVSVPPPTHTHAPALALPCIPLSSCIAGHAHCLACVPGLVLHLHARIYCGVALPSLYLLFAFLSQVFPLPCHSIVRSLNCPVHWHCLSWHAMLLLYLHVGALFPVLPLSLRLIIFLACPCLYLSMRLCPSCLPCPALFAVRAFMSPNPALACDVIARLRVAVLSALHCLSLSLPDLSGSFSCMFLRVAFAGPCNVSGNSHWYKLMRLSRHGAMSVAMAVLLLPLCSCACTCLPGVIYTYKFLIRLSRHS